MGSTNLLPNRALLSPRTKASKFEEAGIAGIAVQSTSTAIGSRKPFRARRYCVRVKR
jgi:hypothetical protein